MNMQYPEPIAKLIDSYMKLPGIGQKTATRLAFYTIDMKDEVVNEFAKSLLSVKRDLHFCSICGNITEEDPCEIIFSKFRPTFSCDINRIRRIVFDHSA